MLQGLDDIDWHHLEHAYGSASDVPEQLRALASHDEQDREKAIHALYGNIWHQGTVYEATAYAVPFLIELASNPAIPERAQILDLLIHLARGSSYRDVHQHLGFLGEKMREEASFDENLHKELTWVERASHAVAQGAPTYLALLDDPEVQIRCHAAQILTRCGDQGQALAPTLRERLQNEESPVVAATLLFTLAALEGEALRPLLSETLRDERPLLRLIAALAQTFFSAEPISDQALETLLGALRRSSEYGDYDKLPFAEDLFSDVGQALAQAGDEVREEAARRLLYALEEGLSNAHSIVTPLLALSFPGPLSEPELTSLSKLQSAVLKGIARRTWAKRKGSWSVFLNFAEDLRRYGLEDLGKRIVGYGQD